MDKLIDTLLDPRFIAAGLIGWAVRSALARPGVPCTVCGQSCGCARDAGRTAAQMAGTVLQRQAGVARDAAVKQLQQVADERTRRIVQSMLPRVRGQEQPRIVQFTVEGRP